MGCVGDAVVILLRYGDMLYDMVSLGLITWYHYSNSICPINADDLVFFGKASFDDSDPVC